MRKLFSLFLALVLALGLAPAFAEEGALPGDGVVIGVVYKQSGNSFFDVAMNGFQQAADELGFTFLHNGPADSSNEGQIQIIEGYIQQGVDVIAVSAVDAEGLVSVLKKARDAGIKVVSWDSAVNPEARDLNINASDASNIGRVQVEEIARQIGYEGQIAILSAAATMDNQNTWIRFMQEELTKEEYANMELITIVYGDDLTDKSYQEMQGLIDAYPDLKGVISPTTMGIAAAANCIQDNGLTGKIKLTGLGLPSEMEEYILAGVCEAMFLWNPYDLGYCTAYTCVALATGASDAAIGSTIGIGYLGTLTILDDGKGNPDSIMGDPYRYGQDSYEDWKDSIF